MLPCFRWASIIWYSTLSLSKKTAFSVNIPLIFICLWSDHFFHAASINAPARLKFSLKISRDNNLLALHLLTPIFLYLLMGSTIALITMFFALSFRFLILGAGKISGNLDKKIFRLLYLLVHAQCAYTVLS